MFGLKTINYCPPCWPGSLSLPPVFCRSYTGRHLSGITLDAIRPGFFNDFGQGRLDAPEFLPAGAHHAPRVTCGGKPVLERAHTIYACETVRE